jgi:hypothetical protein
VTHPLFNLLIVQNFASVADLASVIADLAEIHFSFGVFLTFNATEQAW